MTSWDAFTGENFRRGGFLPQDKRYERAREFLAATRELWDSWRGDEIVADDASGTFVADPDAGRFAVHSDAVRHRGPLQGARAARRAAR